MLRAHDEFKNRPDFAAQRRLTSFRGADVMEATTTAAAYLRVFNALCAS